MDILVGFNNTFKTPGFPCLGLLSVHTMEFRFVEFPPEIPQTGILGMAISSKYIFLGLQHSSGGPVAYLSPPALLIFEREKFKLLKQYTFQMVRDVHSFLLSADEATLYFVSTGTDEVVAVALNDTEVVSERVIWRPDPVGEQSDNYHLNSIYEWQGEIYVSGFGKKEILDDWNSAKNGFVYNITKEELIASGFEHPHSISVLNGNMAICESRRRKFTLINREKEFEVPGYARGLCMTEGKLFIGTSVRRSKSKSTGKKLAFQANLESARCTISRVCSENFKIEEVLNLENYAIEIYELLPVRGTEKWPVFKPRNFQLSFEKDWAEKLNTALMEIKSVVPTGESFVLVADNQWDLDKNVLPDHQPLHFLEQNGVYWGNPENDEVAIHELTRMQQQGTQYLAFGWPSFWWFNYYKEFNSHLRNEFTCVLENEWVVMFDLSK